MLVVTVYSYLASGAPIWYLADGPVTNNVFTSTLDKYQDGQCISCSYQPAAMNGNDGNMSITFTSPTAATMALPGGRNFPIVPQPFGGGTAQSITPQAGLWWNPAESGTGYALDYKQGVLVVTVYSYTTAGPPIWYLASGPEVNNTFTSTLDKYQDGQCISCAYRPAAMNGNDGNVSITFTSPTTAIMTLPGGRNFQIVPQAF